MELTLGRLNDNDHVINDPNVSSKQLKITYITDNELLIEDLGSTNHTFVNSTRIKSKIIAKDDQVSLGSRKLVTMK